MGSLSPSAPEKLLSAGRARSGTMKGPSDNAQTSKRRDVPTETAPARYRRVTVYLTEEQHRWARRAALSTVDDGPALSASDVVRLALERLRAEGGDLREALLTKPGRRRLRTQEGPSVGC